MRCVKIFGGCTNLGIKEYLFSWFTLIYLIKIVVIQNILITSRSVIYTVITYNSSHWR